MTNYPALIEDLAAALHNAIRIIEHKDGTDPIDTGREVLERARGVLSQIRQPEPVPRNCWLDDDVPCPTPCVFDDPSEQISNCVLASKLVRQGKPKTCCEYYRAQWGVDGGCRV